MLYSKDRESQNWEDHLLFLLPHNNDRVSVGGTLMREESGRVYSYSGYPREEETLLYDFNLQEGDTISYYLQPHSFDSDGKIISRVDSVRYMRINSLPRKVFYISNYRYAVNNYPGISEVWIEGIGSLWRLERDQCKSYYSCCGSPDWSLLCFHQNEKLLYHSPDFNDCYYHWILGNPKIDSNLDFQLYPNPSSGRFTIQASAENGNSQVQIFDISGRQIRSYQTDYSGYLEVNLLNVSPGIYLVRLSKPGFSGTKKVVIN